MKTKSAFLLIILIFMSITTGCWDRTELSDIAIATIAALDKGDNGKIQMALMISIAKQIQSGGSSVGSSNKKDYILISGEGDSVMDAFEEIQKKTSRNLFLSHLKVLIIGEKLARSGVADSLDFFSRYRESRLGKAIVFTKNNASDLLDADAGLDRLLSETIREELNFNNLSKISLRDFLNMLTEDGIEPMGVAIEMVNLVNEKDKSSSQKSCGICGLALFHKDKLVGWLDNKESIGVSWIKGTAKLNNFSMEIPKEYGGGRIGVLLRTQSTKTKAVVNENRIEMNIRVKSNSIIFESSSKLDLSKHKAVHYIEKVESDYVKNLIDSSLKKIQLEYGIDVLGFGKAVYNENPKLWSEKYEKIWDNEFRNVKVNITPIIQIPRIGFDTKSTTIPEKEFLRMEG